MAASEVGSGVRAEQLKPLLPLAVMVGLSVLTACMLAGDAAVLALSRFAMDGGVVLAWGAAAAGFGGWILKLLRFQRSHIALHLSMSLGLGWGLMSILSLGLGLAGAVGPGAAWGQVVAGCVAGVFLLRGRQIEPADEAELGRAWRWAVLGFIPLLGMALFLSLFPPGFLWREEPNAFDVVAYHFQIPREWYELGRIVPLKHNVFSYMPLGMEMHYLAAMGLLGGPFAGAYAAQMMHLAFFAATAMAAYGALRPEGRGPAMVAAITSVAAPYCLLLAPIGYNEGVQLLYGTLLLAVCLRGRPDWRAAAIAGLCAGFAVGAKLTAIPLWGVGGLVALVGAALTRTRGQGEHAVTRLDGIPSAVGSFVLAAALAASPWLIRTAVWSGGNPIFPLAARQLGQAHFTDEQVDRFNRAHSPREDQKSVAARLKAFREQVLAAREFGFVLLPVAVFAGFAALRRSGWLLAVLLLHVAVWLFATHLQSRFFAPALPMFALMLGLAAARFREVAILGLLLTLGLSIYSVTVAWSGLNHLRDPATKALITTFIGADVPAIRKALEPEDLKTLPPNITLNLVGEGKAYFYTRPMSRLKYTTVFDAAGPDIATAWRTNPGEALWIDPGELARYHKTYQTPLPPPEWQRPQPFLVAP